MFPASYKGFKEPDIYRSPSMVGSILAQLHPHFKPSTPKISSRKTSRKGYKHRYPRTLSTYNRTSKAVEIMRNIYKYSMNDIALAIQINVHTVQRRLKDLRKMGVKISKCIKRSKNSAKKRTLLTRGARIQSFIDDKKTSLELYAALGIKPPPRGVAVHFFFLILLL